MRLTHGGLPAKIAWVSTCLLAGGASTLFNESYRVSWMLWGCFGLAAAVGLDVVARARERVRLDELQQIADRRFDRETLFATEESIAIAAIGEAVIRICGLNPQTQNSAGSRRVQERYACDLKVELLVNRIIKGPKLAFGTCSHLARLTNISNVGFELTLSEPLARERLVLHITTVNGDRETMLGEILWTEPRLNGSQVAGGHFLNVLTADNMDSHLSLR